MIKLPGRYSPAYIGTIMNDPTGLAEYEAFKAELRLKNLESRTEAKKSGGTWVKRKVDCFGRLGKNNPAASEYKTGGKKGWNGYKRIDRAHATTIDIYVNLHTMGLVTSW